MLSRLLAHELATVFRLRGGINLTIQPVLKRTIYLLYKRSLEFSRERAKYVKVGIFLFKVFMLFLIPLRNSFLEHSWN